MGGALTSGVDHVEFLVDGVLRAVDSEAPYEFAWDAGQEALGDHALEEWAFDVAGNEAAHTLVVKTVPTTPAGLAATLAKLAGSGPPLPPPPPLPIPLPPVPWVCIASPPSEVCLAL